MSTICVERAPAVRRRKLALSAAALVAVTGAFVATTPAAASSAHMTAGKPLAVPIQKNTFMPKDLNIPVGQVVTWTNLDDAPHTVTTISGPVKFDSGLFGKGKSWTYTFATAGVYKYYCAVHPDMAGTITVAGKGP